MTSASASRSKPEAITVHRRATLDLDWDCDCDGDSNPEAVTERSPRLFAFCHCIRWPFLSRSGGARHPFRWAVLAMRHGIENQLYPARNTYLIKDAEQIFLDGVLAKSQLDGDSSIGQAVGYERDDLFFARRQ